MAHFSIMAPQIIIVSSSNCLNTHTHKHHTGPHEGIKYEYEKIKKKNVLKLMMSLRYDNNWQAYAESFRKIRLMNSKTWNCSHNKTHQLNWQATGAGIASPKWNQKQSAQRIWRLQQLHTYIFCCWCCRVAPSCIAVYVNKHILIY